ncbi:purine-cytosine permease family protein [Planctomycetota bacterium]
MTAVRSSEAIKRLDQLYEFDRQPVTPDKLLGGSYFAGSYAGEHVAATEFVIGAMFVNWGVAINDVIFGLAIGNLLAVLSWALVCAPIATQTRLTLYWYLRRIGGPVFTLIYNVLNAVLFCILAGAMITVAASAVRIPFGIEPQTQWYPTDWRFVLVVLAVGAVVVSLAILGFKKLAAFASVCSPWMLLMFLAGALAVLPILAENAGFNKLDSLDKFWQMGKTQVWIGQQPDGSPPAISFWEVMAFAWICNLAMHLGLADMALLRYAKKSSYGYFSAFGMFLGHYMAWILAGVMGAGAAILLNQPLTELDSGAVAYQALGAAGALAVVIAGWTTSNPTLYRAGLGLQSVTPNWPRWLVTLVAGSITTIIACFPFVFTKLLDFVGWYGLLLSPAGAIVITEHWIFPKLKLTPFWFTQQKKALNFPALIAWLAGIVIALGLFFTNTLPLFFLFFPVYIITSLIYILLAWKTGAKGPVIFESDTSPLAPDQSSAAPCKPQDIVSNKRTSLYWISFIIAAAALIACVILPAKVFIGGIEGFREQAENMKSWILLPTIIYFVAGTAWQIIRGKSA